MLQPAPVRRGYRHHRREGSAGGYVIVFLLGMLLLLASLGGGYVLYRKPELIPGSNARPEAGSNEGTGNGTGDGGGTADAQQVCADVKQHNTEYADKVTTAIRKGVELVVDGDEAGAQKSIEDATALGAEWSGKLQEQATKTDNAELQQAINDLVNELKALESGNASLDDMNNIVEGANASLAKHCA